MTVERPAEEDYYALFVKLSKENPTRVYTQAEKDDFGNAFDEVEHWLNRDDCQLALGATKWDEPTGILITAPNEKAMREIQDRLLSEKPLSDPLSSRVPVYLELEFQGPLSHQVGTIKLSKSAVKQPDNVWWDCVSWLFRN
jgi:hypothetical protein